MSKNVVIYLRVSTAEQSLENQMPALENWIASRGYNLIGIYQEQESAWRAGHQRELARLIDELPNRKVDIVLVWALDRLTREGVSRIFQLISQFRARGVQVISYQESWTEQSGPLNDLLLSIAAWVAEYEAKRISERTRAGLARAKLNGKVLGRPLGSRDRGKRKRGGYLLRYAK
jgi:DNA invertase Pin-like site-specific DNA recombinase